MVLGSLIEAKQFQPSLSFDIWENELCNDPDKEFLLNGIKDGFRITEKNMSFQPTIQDNYRSATHETTLAEVENQNQFEIVHGHY